MSPRVRVYVVVGMRFYREGLVRILGESHEIDVAGTSPRWLDAIPALPHVDPDVVLLEIAGPEACLAVRELCQCVPRARVIALGLQEAEDAVIPLAEAGISGYVNRESSVAELVSTILSVERGDMPCSPRIAGSLLRHVAALAARRGPLIEPALTHRQHEVLSLLRGGLSNKEIAVRLSISLPTVKNHVHQILEKLQVTRRYQAALLGSFGPEAANRSRSPRERASARP